jgi:hypothetical protein
MAKLVDARDLKSLDHCDRAGSIPAPGTMIDGAIAKWLKAWDCKSLIPGSSPGGASTKLRFFYGQMAELVECTGLENRRGSYLPGFESLSVRHATKQFPLIVSACFRIRKEHFFPFHVLIFNLIGYDCFTSKKSQQSKEV